MSGTEDEIRFTVRGRVGEVIPNRPKALNALTTEMCVRFLAQLKTWERDPAIACVLVRSEHERAFCAGGDIVMLSRSKKAGTEDWRRFFATEFRLNTAIKELSKPYVALIDGITMGGGVGISVHGTYRVASERTRLAMPETGIGYFTDVGGTYFLPRLPDAVGVWLGLTGASIGGADAFRLGIATHFVPHERQGALVEALTSDPDLSAAGVKALLDGAHEDPGPAPIEDELNRIALRYSRSSVAGILAALERDAHPRSIEERAELGRKSPASLAVTFAALDKGRHLSFREAMAMELRIASHMLEAPDFHEGVRALLIDKDKAPKWNPPTLEAMTPARVESYFSPYGEDLTFSD